MGRPRDAGAAVPGGRRSAACSRSCPHRRDGLSGTERRALRAIAEGARTPAAAFLAAQDLEHAPFLGDTWFYRALAGSAAGASGSSRPGTASELPSPPPLGDGRLFAGAPVRLTPRASGRSPARSDRVVLLGIDRWVGGTHVTPSALAMGRETASPGPAVRALKERHP